MNYVTNAFNETILTAPLWAVILSVLIIHELTHICGTLKVLYRMMHKTLSAIKCFNKPTRKLVDTDTSQQIPYEAKTELFLVGKEGNYPLYHMTNT